MRGLGWWAVGLFGAWGALAQPWVVPVPPAVTELTVNECRYLNPWGARVELLLVVGWWVQTCPLSWPMTAAVNLTVWWELAHHQERQITSAPMWALQDLTGTTWLGLYYVREGAQAWWWLRRFRGPPLPPHQPTFFPAPTTATGEWRVTTDGTGGLAVGSPHAPATVHLGRTWAALDQLHHRVQGAGWWWATTPLAHVHHATDCAWTPHPAARPPAASSSSPKFIEDRREPWHRNATGLWLTLTPWDLMRCRLPPPEAAPLLLWSPLDWTGRWEWLALAWPKNQTHGPVVCVAQGPVAPTADALSPSWPSHPCPRAWG